MLVFLLFKLILGDFGPAGNNKSYEVPDVRGMTVGEAQLMDGVKDVFEIVVKGTQRSDTYEAGQIIQQSPEGGHRGLGGRRGGQGGYAQRHRQGVPAGPH